MHLARMETLCKDWKFETSSLTQNSEIANIGIPDGAQNRTLDPYLQEKPQTLTRVNNTTVQKVGKNS